MFEKTLDSLIYLIQVNQLKYNDQWERIICLIEKGYGNGFFKVWIKTPMDENQTIHNRTTTWLVWMQNYSSLSSSSSSQPSRFPPCCFRRVSYTSHSITCTLTDWDFEFGVFLNRVSSGNHGWKKEDSTTLSTTPSTTSAALESLISGFHLLLNPFLLKVYTVSWTFTKSFLSDKPLKSFSHQGTYLESYTI